MYCTPEGNGVSATAGARGDVAEGATNASWGDVAAGAVAEDGALAVPDGDVDAVRRSEVVEQLASTARATTPHARFRVRITICVP